MDHFLYFIYFKKLVLLNKLAIKQTIMINYHTSISDMQKLLPYKIYCKTLNRIVAFELNFLTVNFQK